MHAHPTCQDFIYKLCLLVIVRSEMLSINLIVFCLRVVTSQKYHFQYVKDINFVAENIVIFFPTENIVKITDALPSCACARYKLFKENENYNICGWQKINSSLLIFLNFANLLCLVLKKKITV